MELIQSGSDGVVRAQELTETLARDCEPGLQRGMLMFCELTLWKVRDPDTRLRRLQLCRTHAECKAVWSVKSARYAVLSGDRDAVHGLRTGGPKRGRSPLIRVGRDAGAFEGVDR